MRGPAEDGSPRLTDRCCNGNSGECSFDSATEYVLPDGSRKTEYHCCY